ncbi:S46 family peptidase [Anaeromyxobacter terrae]|uniref:S46 family peptidase n=1 Tax=Anaeromyxobacter terrae TaxID=2925406 RepID=UPI001F5AFA76|nr:S46 family peptidase [Anaeromyxobacter sp. SG22]
MKRLVVALALLAPLAAVADEGMWTYDAFPSDKVEKKYGFRPSDAWLENARLSSARLAGGCSASFVSEDGLVMTNHHCAHECIEQLSTAQKDFVKSGFYAKTQADEVKCPTVEVNQLVQISDVTQRVRAATKGLEGEAYHKALQGEMARIEKECQTSADLRCDVVTLYQGGVYDLYKYRRFQDVRLVFAPEFAIAFFGGDPDNFMFPRYDLDVSFLRVYQGGKPAKMKNHFRWSQKGAEAGELTFVSGHPGGTDRALTVAQLETQRDVVLPDRLQQLAELRGLLTGFQLLGPEQKRISNAHLFYVENGYKALRGRLLSLQDRAFFRSLAANEEALKAQLAKDPRGKDALPAFDAIAKAQDRVLQLRDEYNSLEGGFRNSTLFAIARDLVRGAVERPKPNPDRLREFRDSNLPALTQELFSEAPIYPEFETLLLGHSLSKIRERLGPDHPVVKKLLGKESPQEVAKRVVETTKLRDVAVRKQLWEGGEAAVKAANDPLLALAAAVDPDARAVRKAFEDEVESVVQKNHERIAEARFAVQGRTTYPDATFTLRLSYGAVEGWMEKGKKVEPFTTFAGAYERNTGRDPFALPESWLATKDRLNLQTRFDFVTSNDIIGGNSGSPVINKNAEIVGLVFDGNIQSLGGDYGFDPAVNRTVAVHSDALIEALTKIYGADRVVQELRPPAKGGKASKPARAASK